MSRDFADLILGTAMWGQRVDENTCMEILDKFYQSGARKIDAATNYPITSDPNSIGLSNEILLKWLKKNQINDLEIIMKIGSINNSGTPENNLSSSYLIKNTHKLLKLFETNLSTIMIHWDNRSDSNEIKNSIEALIEISKNNLNIGLSGIAHPEYYLPLIKNISRKIIVEAKHNMLDSTLDQYQILKNEVLFYAYGINAGGLRLDNNYKESSSFSIRNGAKKYDNKIISQIRKICLQILKDEKDISSFNQINLVYSGLNPNISGIILGPSTVLQLEESLNFTKNISLVKANEIYFRIIQDLIECKL